MAGEEFSDHCVMKSDIIPGFFFDKFEGRLNGDAYIDLLGNSMLPNVIIRTVTQLWVGGYCLSGPHGSYSSAKDGW